MNHPYAIPTTNPATGGGGSTSNSTRSPPPTTTTTTTNPSTSSGSVNRKLVIDPIHGHTREETREERRARKERERQSRESSTSNTTTTTTRLPTSSSTTSNTSTSSKSVLTIALQRAQSAVLLDSANNFPAAISAYSQSVRLLKEVMARVESKGLSAGAVEMERKGSTGSTFSILSSGSSSNLARRESETVEEWEKRKSRWEKKEKAKADEARRLKVIHDTYEDRIKMLLAMNPSLASSVSPSIAAAVLPTSTSNPTRLGGGATQSQPNGGNPSSPTTASMRFHRRRSSTELPQPQTRHRSTPSSSSATSVSASSRPNSPASSVANNLGQAMLSTDLASPISPHASNGIPRIAQLPIISPSNSLHNIPSSTQQDSSYLSHLNLNPQSRPLSTASDSTAKALPLPSTSSSTSPSGTATPTALTSNTSISNLSRPSLPPPTSSLPPPPPVPDHPPPPIPTTANDNHHRNSNSSEEDLDENGEKRIPVTALEFGKDWPSQESRSPEDGELGLPVVDRDPLVSDDRPGGVGGTPPRRNNVFPVTRNSSNSSPMRRGSSASAVYTLQSTSRPPTIINNNYEGGGGGGGVSSASIVMRRTMSSEGATSSSILRPARSASLASQGQGQVYSSGMVPSLSGGSSNSSFSIIGTYGGTRSTTPQTQEEVGGGLVSNSTAGGTISQRRLGGTINQGDRDQSQEHLEATIVVRAPSQESYRSSQSQGQAQGYDEFGSRAGGGGGGAGFGSLPGRLRALSQPSSSQKRPKLPINSAGSWISETNSSTSSTSPPLPPLLSQTPSSTNPSHRHHLPSLSISSTTAGSSSSNRKPLIPTPTSLNAPPFPSTLGRSNSSSSVGSSASGRYSDRSLPPPVPSTTPGTSLHSNYQNSSTTTPGGGGGGSNFGGIPLPPNRSSASSRETVLSIPPVRRPFHLMRLVLATMPTSNSATSPSASRSSVISIVPQGSGGGGGYLSEKLYVPSQIWSIPGSRLVSLETKVRMMEIVLSSLSSLSQVGQSLLSPALANTARNSGSGGERWCLDEAGRFMKELESFEGVVEGVQNTLSKKLGGGLINPTGGGIGHSATNNSGYNDREFGGFGPGGGTKESGGGSLTGKDRKGSTAGGQFASWSSKFQRGFDRVTNANGVSLDSQATYVDTIARLFRQSQCIDHHLALLLSASSSTSQSEASAYALLPLSEKHRLERQLRRASEFFGTVVCRFVMKDVGLLLDKYVKRGGAWLSGE
ncbi:hypothetical protein JCM3765_006917 [Sporobolomyces pararoseus]